MRSLPLDVIKIDCSFIMRANENIQDEEIIKTIVALGHIFGLAVVAEGVETAVEVDLLKKIGCERAQGFYSAKPMPSDELECFLNL